MKTIFITGTSAGLGKAAVQLFQSKGWNVIATMRNMDKAKDFENLERVQVLPLDISDPDQINDTVTRAFPLADVDVVLNNAAYGTIGPLESVSDKQLTDQVTTNLLGAIRVTQAFIPYFRERRAGMVVNVTSIAGLVTFPFDSLTGRSLSTFKRDFERLYGTTPGKWLLRRKLEDAHYILKERKVRPTDVYLEVGFKDYSHFFDSFKKQYGVAPSAWREASVM